MTKNILKKLTTLQLAVQEAAIANPDEHIYEQVLDHLHNCEQLLKVIEEDNK